MNTKTANQSIFLPLLFTFTYILGIPPLSHSQGIESSLKTIFSGIDQNSDQALDKNEYLNYYEKTVAPGIIARHSAEGADKLEQIHEDNRRRLIEGPFGQGDKNGDGKLNFDEYRDYNASLMKAPR
jgi:hypothetical protein